MLDQQADDNWSIGLNERAALITDRLRHLGFADVLEPFLDFRLKQAKHGVNQLSLIQNGGLNLCTYCGGILVDVFDQEVQSEFAEGASGVTLDGGDLEIIGKLELGPLTAGRCAEAEHDANLIGILQQEISDGIDHSVQSIASVYLQCPCQSVPEELVHSCQQSWCRCPLTCQHARKDCC